MSYYHTSNFPCAKPIFLKGRVTQGAPRPSVWVHFLNDLALTLQRWLTYLCGGGWWSAAEDAAASCYVCMSGCVGVWVGVCVACISVCLYVCMRGKDHTVFVCWWCVFWCMPTSRRYSRIFFCTITSKYVYHRMPSWLRSLSSAMSCLLGRKGRTGSPLCSTTQLLYLKQFPHSSSCFCVMTPWIMETCAQDTRKGGGVCEHESKLLSIYR